MFFLSTIAAAKSMDRPITSTTSVVKYFAENSQIPLQNKIIPIPPIIIEKTCLCSAVNFSVTEKSLPNVLIVYFVSHCVATGISATLSYNTSMKTEAIKKK